MHARDVQLDRARDLLKGIMLYSARASSGGVAAAQ
jgi:hypothetical protein